MLKHLVIIAMASFLTSTAEADKISDLQNEINLEMCRSKDHHFSMTAANCTYCAQGLHYNEATAKCEGTSNVFGKCIAEDHYHATTQECMYCAKGFSFDENLRHCTEVVATKEKK